ncbi:hypothetical protein [Aurantiacibacter hainanensis]|uniref:hypothetical protein n=1 Tax=Aurantiacibacter hainanensis TaxID=3076114 RepID=UPI0030C65C33
MGFYVSLDGVDDGTLLLAGFVLIEEGEAYKIYRHYGEDVIVDKDDPFVVVEDINDAAVLGSEIIPIPPENNEH